MDACYVHFGIRMLCVCVCVCVCVCGGGRKGFSVNWVCACTGAYAIFCGQPQWDCTPPEPAWVPFPSVCIHIHNRTPQKRPDALPSSRKWEQIIITSSGTSISQDIMLISLRAVCLHIHMISIAPTIEPKLNLRNC